MPMGYGPRTSSSAKPTGEVPQLTVATNADVVLRYHLIPESTPTSKGVQTSHETVRVDIQTGVKPFTPVPVTPSTATDALTADDPSATEHAPEPPAIDSGRSLCLNEA